MSFKNGKECVLCIICVYGKVAGISIFTEKDELSVQYDFTPFIGFVFVDEQLISRQEVGLYEKYGFVKLGDYEMIYDSIDQLFVQHIERAN